MKHKLSMLSDAIVQPESLLAKDEVNRLFIDVRLGEPADEFRDHRDCHILGAVHAQIREVFADPPTPESGNLPLPSLARLAGQLQVWGVNKDTEIILYGPSMALAARGWWVLRWAGLRKAKVLDGGLKAWVNQGGPVAQGETRRTPAAAPPDLRAGQMRQIDVSGVERLAPDTLVIDARDENAYLAGHLPGARNLPSAEQWTPGGGLRTVDEVRALYASVGIRDGGDIVVYCGGGVLSAFTVLTLEALGYPSRLYVGSWSEWSKSPARMARSASEGRTS